MRPCVGIGAAALALVTALTGCGSSVPGLSGLGGSDGVLLPGTVFGSARTERARPAQPRQAQSGSLWDIKALLGRPPDPKFSSERTETAGSTAVRVREVTFGAEPVPGTSLSLFGYLVTPAQAGSDRSHLPALVLIGDRPAAASVEQASVWAARGYVALALDLPGRGPGREAVRSSGPDWTDAALVSSDPAANPLHGSVAAAIAAASLLASQPEVDAQRIGLVGEGWGGVVAALAGSVDSRPRALVLARTPGDPQRSALAAALEALPASAREVWTRSYSPDAYANAHHPATLFVRPLTSGEPPLDSVIASSRGWAGEKELALVPPDAKDGEAAAEAAWLGAHLLGGVPLPEILDVRPDSQGVIVRTRGEVPPGSVRVYSTASDLSKADWRSATCDKVGDSVWRSTLPQPAAAPSLMVFASIIDSRGAIVCSEPGQLAQGRLTARSEPVAARPGR